jgi:NarL family two-component system response regulator LiaR
MPILRRIQRNAALVLSRAHSHEWRERSSWMTAEAPTRVITADDDPFARRVVKAALQAAGMTVVAEAKNGREAVQLALHYRPDVVVMDVVMPELDGLLATRQILKAQPDQLVVVLTGGAEHELGLLALQAGAVGFLSKEVDIDALPRALEGVRRGEAAISREMTRRLVESYRATAHGATGLRPIKSPLTPREWEVIELLKPDRSPEHVADTLVLSIETVRSHIKNIMRKLDVHSRADAVAAAERLRIATPNAAS